MGNCLIIRNNQKVSAQDYDDDNYDEQPRESEVEQKKITTGSSFESEENMKKKKRIKKKVRFELQKEEERIEETCRRSGSVRIRLVVTQEELKEILSHESDTQHTTLEQLLSSVKLGGSRICQVTREDDGAMNAWRPTLESIPEDISQ